MNTFSISDVLGTGWKITKERFWFLAGATLIVIVLGNISALLGSGRETEGPIIFGLVQYVLNLFLEIGMIRIALNLLDGKEASYRDFWSGANKILPLLGASVLFGIMFVIGMVLLIVPGIIVSLTFCMFYYFIIDKGVGVIESLKMSAAATKGNKWHLLGFLVVAGLLNVAGVLLLGVGLLVTVPVTTLAFAAVYRKLTANLTPMVVPATPSPVATT